MNLLKMKLFMLFGVVQMIVGLLLRWSSTIFKRSCLDIICEYVSMMIFRLCFFCWMGFMVLYRWNVPERLLLVTYRCVLIVLTYPFEKIPRRLPKRIPRPKRVMPATFIGFSVVRVPIQGFMAFQIVEQRMRFSHPQLQLVSSRCPQLRLQCTNPSAKRELPRVGGAF